MHEKNIDNKIYKGALDMGRFTIQYAVRSVNGEVKEIGKVGIISTNSDNNSGDTAVPVKTKTSERRKTAA